jgi:hypothetical protein
MRSQRRASCSSASIVVPSLYFVGAQGQSRDERARAYAGEASIRSSEEQDRSRHHSAHRGGLELSTGTGLYGACRPVDPVLSGCVV